MSAALAWTHVQSSNIDALSYSEKSKKLAVRFNSGALYVYHDVDHETYEQMLDSPSVGRYLKAVIELTCGYDRCSSDQEVADYFSSV